LGFENLFIKYATCDVTVMHDESAVANRLGRNEVNAKDKP